jgi:symplekin
VTLSQNDMRRQLPRIISILPGKALAPDTPPPERDMVRQILTQVIAPPIAANATPAVKKKALSQGFTAAELMVLLHNCEKESGLKATMDGPCREPLPGSLTCSYPS